MEYARVADGQVTEILKARPNWFDENGIPVSDQWFIDNEGIYPVIITHRTTQSLIKTKPETDWIITETYIEKTFWIVDENLPAYNPLIEKIEAKRESEWIEDGENIKKTYEITPCSPEEAQRYVDTYSAVTPNIDHSKNVLKPLQEWSFHDNIITKTYWEIIEDPERENYPEIFYTHLQNELEDWVKTQSTIQKTYTYIQRETEDIVNYLKQNLEILRWKIETDGFSWNGKDIHTDRESQTKILTAFVAAKEGIQVGDIKWKTKNGFILLTPTEIQAMSMTIFNNIEQLYATEDTIIQKIEAAVSQNTDEIVAFNALNTIYDNLLSEPWPQNFLYIKERAVQ